MAGYLAVAELGGLSVVVRSDAGETPSMSRDRARMIAARLNSQNSQNSQPPIDADSIREAASMARRCVCEKYLGCSYAKLGSIDSFKTGI